MTAIRVRMHPHSDISVSSHLFLSDFGKFLLNDLRLRPMYSEVRMHSSFASRASCSYTKVLSR